MHIKLNDKYKSNGLIVLNIKPAYLLLMAGVLEYSIRNTSFGFPDYLTVDAFDRKSERGIISKLKSIKTNFDTMLSDLQYLEVQFEKIIFHRNREVYIVMNSETNKFYIAERGHGQNAWSAQGIVFANYTNRELPSRKNIESSSLFFMDISKYYVFSVESFIRSILKAKKDINELFLPKINFSENIYKITNDYHKAQEDYLNMLSGLLEKKTDDEISMLNMVKRAVPRKR